MSNSILAGLGQLIQPLFTPLGFGAQLGAFGWVFAVAAITGLIAKENVIATFLTLAVVFINALEAGKIDPSLFDAEQLAAILEAMEQGESTTEGVAEAYMMIVGTGITWQGCISFIAFNMLTIPCFAACATAKAELKKGTFKYTLLFWIIASFLGAGFVYAFLSCFSLSSLAWALPVTIALVIALVSTFITIHHINKRKVVAA